MDQAADIFGMTCARQLRGQGDMRLGEGLFVAVQDGHQVDDRIMPAHQGLQLLGVVHICLHHRHAR